MHRHFRKAQTDCRTSHFMRDLGETVRQIPSNARRACAPGHCPPETGQRWGLEGGHGPSQQELAGVLQGLGDRFPGTSPRSRKPSPHVALAGPEGVVHWWGLWGSARAFGSNVRAARRRAFPTQGGLYEARRRLWSRRQRPGTHPGRPRGSRGQQGP